MNKLVKVDVVKGSILDTARQKGITIEQAFLQCSHVVLLDVSGSMGMQDANGNRKRFDVACEELEQIQAGYPGQVALVVFSSGGGWRGDVAVKFCPGGVPEFLGETTDMVAGLRFVQAADGSHKIILVSDGEPDEPEETLRVVEEFKSPIDTIYVGPDGGEGWFFLQEVARKTGGKRFIAPKPGELGAGVVALLEDRNGG